MSEPVFRAVSADSHVNPAPEMWSEYLSPELRARADRRPSSEPTRVISTSSRGAAVR